MLAVFDYMKTGVTTKVTNIKDAIVNGITKAIDWIKSLPSQALQWGADIINSIADGIKSAVSNVVDAVSGVAQTIWDYIHFSEPEVGPLRNFHTFMPDMMREMVNGINRGIPMLENAMNGMASTLVPGKGNGSNNMTANNTFNTRNSSKRGSTSSNCCTSPGRMPPPDWKPKASSTCWASRPHSGASGAAAPA